MASIAYEIGDGNDENHLDIVIKLLPHDPFGRYFVTINQFDLREIQFYTKVCSVQLNFNSWLFVRIVVAKLRAKSLYLQIYADLTNFQKNNLKSDAEPLCIAVPKCFYSRYTSGLLSQPLADDSSPEPPESILVLQDMRPLGYQTANLSKGLSLEEAESAIEAIAAVHALTLGMKIKEKIDLNEKYPVNGGESSAFNCC